MSRRVKKIPRVKRTTRGSSSYNNSNYNDNSGYGNQGASYMMGEANSNELRSFDSQPISRKKAIPLRRSDDRSGRDGSRYSNGGDNNMYSRSENSHFNNNDNNTSSRRGGQEQFKQQQSPKKQAAQEDDSDDDNYDDDDFDDYNDDEFDDMSDEDDKNTTAESKSSYNKIKEKTGGATLRFPTAKLNEGNRDSYRTNDNENGGSSKYNNDSQFGVVSSPHAKSKMAHSKRELDVNPARERRLRELKKMINLTEESKVTLSLAPLQPYDVYIRKLGSKTWKQAANFTNDDVRTTDTQTADITYNDQSGQVPDDLGFGNNNNNNSNTKNNSNALLSFLRRISPVIEISLEENSEDQNLESKLSDTDDDNDVNKASFLKTGSSKPLKYPVWLTGRKLTAVATATNSATSILTSYGPKEINERISANNTDLMAFTASLAGKGLTCVWHTDQVHNDDVTLPYKALLCEGVATCCAFSPLRAHIVVAGTLSGSILLWDLREPSSYHVNEESVYFKYADSFRRPTYTTDALVLKPDDQVRTEGQHCAPVVDIRPIAVGNSKGGRFQSGAGHSSFQLASLDQDGVIILWTALEMRSIDEAGSETDLGLGIGGRIKLTRTSRMQINSRSVGKGITPKLETYAFGVFPNDNSHFIIGTANGSLIHKSRFASVVTPRIYECGMVEALDDESSSSSCSAVLSIDFNPFLPTLFLVALNDGSLSLYKNDYGTPITVWTGECIGLRVHDDDGFSMPYIVNVKWSKTRPAVFFILDTAGTLYAWDLLQKQHGPISSQNPLPDSKRGSGNIIQHFDLTSCLVKGVKSNMFVGTSNGDGILFEIANRYSTPRSADTKSEARQLQEQINFF